MKFIVVALYCFACVSFIEASYLRTIYTSSDCSEESKIGLAYFTENMFSCNTYNTCTIVTTGYYAIEKCDVAVPDFPADWTVVVASESSTCEPFVNLLAGVSDTCWVFESASFQMSYNVTGCNVDRAARASQFYNTNCKGSPVLSGTYPSTCTATTGAYTQTLQCAGDAPVAAPMVAPAEAPQTTPEAAPQTAPQATPVTGAPVANTVKTSSSISLIRTSSLMILSAIIIAQ